MKKKFLILLLVPLLGLAACKKDEPAVVGGGGGTPETILPNSFKIDGDGFSKQRFNLGIAGSNEGYYDASTGMSTVTAAGTNDSLDFNFTLNFPNKTVGTKAFGSTTYGTVTIINKKTSASKDYNSVGGAVVVNKYESVGGTIEGTFSGTFRESSSQDEVKIEDGRFSVVRGVDL